MTWLVQRAVTCDHDGCGAGVRGDDGEPMLSLQFAARALGWQVERFKPDYCPVHNASGVEQEAG